MISVMGAIALPLAEDDSLLELAMLADSDFRELGSMLN